MSFNGKFKYWFPVFLWMSLIFWMSTEAFSVQKTSFIIESVLRFWAASLSEKEVRMIQAITRKLAHVIEYFILGLLLFRAFRSGSAGGRNRSWAFSSLVVVVLYAAGDEFHQSFVSTRTASIVDVAIDVMGGILAQGASVLWGFRHK